MDVKVKSGDSIKKKSAVSVKVPGIERKPVSALRVPATIVRLESNITLNPLFKDFRKVEILEFIDLIIDERLKTSTR